MTHKSGHVIIDVVETEIGFTHIKVRDIIGAIVGGGLVFLFI